MNRKHLFRTLRNLGLAALVGLVIWSLADFPLPMEQEFRRSERTHLAERSEIVWTHEGTAAGDDDLLVGLSDTAVHVWHPNGYFLSQVIHAAKIEVNEQGTEAAAATVVEANSGSGAPPETGVTLIFDQSFLYGIVDLQTGVPLFLGTFE